MRLWPLRIVLGGLVPGRSGEEGFAPKVHFVDQRFEIFTSFGEGIFDLLAVSFDVTAMWSCFPMG